MLGGKEGDIEGKLLGCLSCCCSHKTFGGRFVQSSLYSSSPSQTCSVVFCPTSEDRATISTTVQSEGHVGDSDHAQHAWENLELKGAIFSVINHKTPVK